MNYPFLIIIFRVADRDRHQESKPVRIGYDDEFSDLAELIFFILYHFRLMVFKKKS